MIFVVVVVAGQIVILKGFKSYEKSVINFYSFFKLIELILFIEMNFEKNVQ